MGPHDYDVWSFDVFVAELSRFLENPQLLGQQPDTSLEADLELDSLDAALVGLFLEAVGVDLRAIAVESLVTLEDLYGTVVMAHADGRFSPGQTGIYPGEYR